MVNPGDLPSPFLLGGSGLWGPPRGGWTPSLLLAVGGVCASALPQPRLWKAGAAALLNSWRGPRITGAASEQQAGRPRSGGGIADQGPASRKEPTSLRQTKRDTLNQAVKGAFR